METCFSDSWRRLSSLRGQTGREARLSTGKQRLTGVAILPHIQSFKTFAKILLDTLQPDLFIKTDDDE
jgi:hypothetical protein